MRLLKRILPAVLAAALAVCSCYDPMQDLEWPPKQEAGEGNSQSGSTSGDGVVPGAGVTIYGVVSCDGTGVKDVVVSDGNAVVVTDAKGVYQLKSTKAHGYVFISVPSGYEVDAEGIIPLFFKRLSKAEDKAERADFNLHKVDQTSYSMLFFGDMHLAGRSFCHDVQQFREFASEVSGYCSGHKTYALTLGDMSWDYFWIANSYDLTDYLEEANRSFPSNLQVFHTMGNHDNDSSLAGDFNAESTFKKIIGPTYYSFNIGGIHYIVLDDVLYKNQTGDRDFYREVSDNQIEWMVRDLSHVSHDTPVFVTMHCPLYGKDGSSYLYNLWDLIKNFDGFRHVQFVTGHTHIVYNVDNLSRSVHVYENNSGAVCGAWWMTGLNYPGLHLSGDGAPGGYRIMDVAGSGFTTRFKGTGIPDDCQFRTYDRNQVCLDASYVSHATDKAKKEFLDAAGEYAVRKTDNEVLINIWDWDTSWTVSVTENGKDLPVKKLSDVKDPLYLYAYEAYELDNGWSISYPAYTTDHFFSVNASAPDSDLDITVTDRYGRTYSEHMTRPKPFPGL